MATGHVSLFALMGFSPVAAFLAPSTRILSTIQRPRGLPKPTSFKLCTAIQAVAGTAQDIQKQEFDVDLDRPGEFGLTRDGAPLHISDITTPDGMLILDMVLDLSEEGAKRRDVFCIGKGGQGWVFKCKVPKLTGKTLACKVVPRSDEVKHEVLEELEVLFSVHHPNIVEAHGYCYNEDLIMVLYEYVQGGDIGGLVSRIKGDKHVMEEREVAAVMRQLLSALDYLHHKNILHSDVKMNNLLMEEDGEIKIADFGSSHQFHWPNEKTSLEHGTLYTQSPEQVGHMPYGIPADVWQVGVAAYEMLYGKTPFGIDGSPDTDDGGAPLSQDDLRSRIIMAKFKIPEDSTVSKDAADFIKQCLERDPRDRTTVEELRKHKWLAGTPSFREGATLIVQEP